MYLIKYEILKTSKYFRKFYVKFWSSNCFQKIYIFLTIDKQLSTKMKIYANNLSFPFAY